MEEAERLADHVVIIDHGRVVAEGSPAALTATAPRPAAVPRPAGPGPGRACSRRSRRLAGRRSRRRALRVVQGAVDPQLLADDHRLVRRAGRAGRRPADRAPHPRGRVPGADRPGAALMTPDAVERRCLAPRTRRRRRVRRMLAAQAAARAAAAAAQRRAAAAHAGHPGAAAGRVRPGAAGELRAGPSRIDFLRPGRARAGGDVHRVHRPGHRDRLRPALRRAQAARRDPAVPRRAARWPRRSPCSRSSCCRSRCSWRRAWPSAGGRTPPGRGRRGACSSCSGTAAFAGLGLLMAGTLRAEATLAAANLVYLVLLGAGGVIFPLDKFPAGARPSWSCCRPARCPPDCAACCSRVGLPRRERGHAADLGRRGDHPGGADLQVGVKAPPRIVHFRNIQPGAGRGSSCCPPS